jgi:probable rRNA maturation factor
MQLILDLQPVIKSVTIPQPSLIELWVKTTLEVEAEQSVHTLKDEYELTIRIVDKPECQQLNQIYRFKNQPTNVLSFPFEAPPQVVLPLLGDLVICHPVVLEQAAQQQKSLEAHWAHMVVHGSLHLLGYDHLDDEQAEKMESLEVSVLQQLGFSNPYIKG